MKTQILFLLDNTGSMQSIKGQTIEGFNSYIKEISEHKKGVRFTLAMFNSESFDVVYDNVKLGKVKELTMDTFTPTALTPLFDSIAKIVNLSKEADRTLCVILTDGYENNSTDNDFEDIKKLIKMKTDEGWTFAYLGADQDAWGIASGMGIQNAYSYTSTETKSAYSALGASTSVYLANSEKRSVNDFFEEDDDG